MFERWVHTPLDKDYISSQPGHKCLYLTIGFMRRDIPAPLGNHLKALYRYKSCTSLKISFFPKVHCNTACHIARTLYNYIIFGTWCTCMVWFVTESVCNNNRSNVSSPGILHSSTFTVDICTVWDIFSHKVASEFGLALLWIVFLDITAYQLNIGGKSQVMKCWPLQRAMEVLWTL